MEVVLTPPTNVVVPSTTRWVDPQATSLGSIPVVCARESGCSCCWPVESVARRFCRHQSGEGRTQQDTPERRAERAQMMVLMGEVSAGRRILEGATLAPGTETTLRKLRQRPPAPRTPIAAEFSRQPDSFFLLDHQEFLKNLKTSRRGAAPGPSGMTAEHVKPLLENDNDAESLCQVAELLCRGHIPSEVLSVIRMGRLTALQKPTRGVRGIVAGDILRRLVARTVAQQIRQQVERATAPFQYARAGCECIAHALQVLTDQDPQSTVLSVDGIGAYDTISRNAMLRGLRHMEGGEAVLPFVLQFYGTPSTYLWEDSEGVVHEILQGEGGEQRDALMPALFALGQHDALLAIQDRLRPEERLFAFLDDIYVWSPSPNRMATLHTTIQEQLLAHTGIQIHQGKTQLWNRAGVAPAGSVSLSRVIAIDGFSGCWVVATTGLCKWSDGQPKRSWSLSSIRPRGCSRSRGAGGCFFQRCRTADLVGGRAMQVHGAHTLFGRRF